MPMWKLEEITGFTRARLSAKRWQHVLGVMEAAKSLAQTHNVAVADAELAALIHDVAKEQNIHQVKRILQLQYEDAYLAHSHKIWHAPMGMIVARETFGVDKTDVLNAIKFHTTGRPAMSTLEKVLFVADYTESGRTYEGCEKVRSLWHNLDEATCEILKQKVEKVEATGGAVHPDTTSALAYYKEVVGA